MIGAIVGEYFGGSQEQLGIQIKNSAALFRFEYGLGGDRRGMPPRHRASTWPWSLAERVVTLRWHPVPRERRRGR